MSVLAAVLFTLSLVWTVSGLTAVAFTVRHVRLPPSAPLPPVSVLKPLCGADPALEDNLESFFRQDHPDLEIVLGVEHGGDPALAVAQRVAARHPHVRSSLVVGGGLSGRNPKVRNLRAMIPHARHDLVVISDSNVRAEPWVVREMVAIAARDRSIGVVTSPIAGCGERSWAGALEAVQLCGFVAAGATLPTLLGDAAVAGKSMLFSLSALDALGGLGRVADVLAEDHVLGKTFQHAGLRVAIAPTPVANVVGAPTLGGVFERHVRWGMMRWRLRPFAFLAEIITCPLALAPLLALSAPPLVALGACLLLAWVRDVGGWMVLRGPRDLHIPLLLSPLRDALAAAAWAVAPFRRHVAWRGHRVRVGAGTLLFGVR